MASTIEQDTVVRVALDSVSHVPQSAVERALAEKRPIRGDEVQWLTKGNVVRFSASEWDSLDPKAKARFGYVTSEQVRSSVMGKHERAVADAKAHYKAADAKVEAAKASLESESIRLRQAIQQAERERDYQLTQLRAVEAELAQVEAQVQREIAGLLGSTQQPETAAQQAARKGNSR